MTTPARRPRVLTLAVTPELLRALEASRAAAQARAPFEALTIEQHAARILAASLHGGHTAAGASLPASHGAHADVPVADLVCAWNEAARRNRKLLQCRKVYNDLRGLLEDAWVDVPDLDAWRAAFEELALHNPWLVGERHARTLRALVQPRRGRYRTFLLGLTVQAYRDKAPDAPTASAATAYNPAAEVDRLCSELMTWRARGREGAPPTDPGGADLLKALSALPPAAREDRVEDAAAALGCTTNTIRSMIRGTCEAA